MININDLRFGNIIRFDDEKLWNKHYDKQLVAVDIDIMLDVFRSPNSFSPVLLTPELLVNVCGFEVTTKGFYTHFNWYNISLKYRNNTYDLRCNFIDRIATNLDYLHQVQNLFYSVVGEELPISGQGDAVSDTTEAK